MLPMAVGLCMPECAQGTVPLGQVGSPSAEALLGSRCVPFCEWGSASPCRPLGDELCLSLSLGSRSPTPRTAWS